MPAKFVADGNTLEHGICVVASHVSIRLFYWINSVPIRTTSAHKLLYVFDSVTCTKCRRNIIRIAKSIHKQKRLHLHQVWIVMVTSNVERISFDGSTPDSDSVNVLKRIPLHINVVADEQFQLDSLKIHEKKWKRSASNAYILVYIPMRSKDLKNRSIWLATADARISALHCECTPLHMLFTNDNESISSEWCIYYISHMNEYWINEIWAIRPWSGDNND